MRNLAIIMFALALFLGTMTVLIARNVINNQRAEPVVITQENEQEMTTLVVAAVKLQFGDEITAEKLKTVPWPKDETVRPAGSFETIADVIGNQRRVAIRAMNINDPLTQEKLSGFGYRATLSQVVPPDMRAVTIRINEITGVAGFVLPGDRVDVLHAYQAPGDTHIKSTLIMRDVRVLAIDQIADETTQGALLANAATLEVTQEQAQKLSLAAKVGSMDLVLRPMRIDEPIIDERSSPVKVTDLTTDNSIAKDEKEDVKKTASRVYRPIKRSNPAPKPDPTSKMKITRGIQTTTTTVQKEGADGTVSDLQSINSQTANGVKNMSNFTGSLLGGSN